MVMKTKCCRRKTQCEYDCKYPIEGATQAVNGVSQMLVVSRTINESIVIGDDITVTVLSMHGKQIRLGIDAPSDVSVHRKEVYVRIQAEQNQESRPESDQSKSAPIDPVT